MPNESEEEFWKSMQLEKTAVSQANFLKMMEKLATDGGLVDPDGGGVLDADRFIELRRKGLI